MDDELFQKQRYQDLSREQAFGLEARILLRILPLLVPKQTSNHTDVHNYFINLKELFYLLCDISLGNKSLESSKLKGKAFYEELKKISLFEENSNFAAKAISHITSMLGQLGIFATTSSVCLSTTEKILMWPTS
jgi:hypothetical protein